GAPDRRAPRGAVAAGDWGVRALRAAVAPRMSEPPPSRRWRDTSPGGGVGSAPRMGYETGGGTRATPSSVTLRTFTLPDEPIFDAPFPPPAPLPPPRRLREPGPRRDRRRRGRAARRPPGPPRHHVPHRRPPPVPPRRRHPHRGDRRRDRGHRLDDPARAHGPPLHPRRLGHALRLPR